MLVRSPQHATRLAPEFVVIGHATCDLVSGDAWRLGGTVTFAALTAHRLGLRVAIVTSGTPPLLAALSRTVPGSAIAASPATEATTFENIYHGGQRHQYLRARARELALADVPPAWRSAPIVLLAPVAQEVDPGITRALSGSLVAATPQGWLRRWDSDGRVSACPLGPAETALPLLRALIVSQDDIAPAHARGAEGDGAAEVQLANWARMVPLVAMTCGALGARLLRPHLAPEHFAAYPAREVDPTGAGDVFAAAFLCELYRRGDPRSAMDFANRCAALSIEREGVAGIPTGDEVTARFSR